MNKTTVAWFVKHGQKPVASRKTSRFSSENLALAFFKEKERDGQYVDVFKETTTVTVEKLTNKEA